MLLVLQIALGIVLALVILAALPELVHLAIALVIVALIVAGLLLAPPGVVQALGVALLAGIVGALVWRGVRAIRRAGGSSNVLRALRGSFSRAIAERRVPPWLQFVLTVFIMQALVFCFVWSARPDSAGELVAVTFFVGLILGFYVWAALRGLCKAWEWLRTRRKAMRA